MDYMTLKEAAEKWGVTPRRVNYYCAAGRIPGAVKMAGVWLIPKNTEKPIDGRTKQGKLQHFGTAYCITQPQFCIGMDIFGDQILFLLQPLQFLFQNNKALR